MNDLISALILAVVQGITEWLPVSSSGHLVIFEHILNYPVDLSFDVALHFGTLMAVFVYFGRDIMDILEALLKRQWSSQKAQLGFLIIIGTIPAAIIGLLFKDLIESAFESLIVVAIGLGITSLLLFISSLDISNKKKSQLTYKDAFIVGCAQALAILPGISRSGSTIASGLLRNLDEKTAMRFSFLLSIPAIFGAGIIEIGNKPLNSELIWATLLSFLIGLASIHFLLKVISKSKKNLRWFGAYATLLAIGLLIYSLI